MFAYKRIYTWLYILLIFSGSHAQTMYNDVG